MPQTLTTKLTGLYTSDNALSSVPDGAMLVADNVVIDRQSVLKPRRGFDRLSAGFSTASHRAGQLWVYQSKLFAHTSNNELQYWTGSAWTALSGTYTKPTNAVRVRAVEANQNLYVTTSAGIKKLDVYSATPVSAGAYKALDLYATVPAPTAAWLTNNYRVTYRMVWGYKDTNGNLILGAPSGRETVRNTSGADCDVSIVATIPSGVTTSWFYQLYRSTAVSDAGGSTENSDELALVYEANPTSSDISAGTVTILDIVPDALRGATIYTATSQQGIALGNEQPPLAGDVATFKGHTFYADVTFKHRFYLTLTGQGAPNGVVADDTVTIGGVTYTAKASETIASAQFKVYSGGTAAQNIRDTALSLVRVINRHSSSTVYAYYLSGQAELPGKILLEERSIGGASFACTSSRATCWSPALPTSGTTQSSSNDADPAGICWSKRDQPEAQPLPYRARAGSKAARILRLVALRDTLFIFKQDGIWRVTGDNAANFQIEPFDASTKLLAPETCAVLGNQIYCLTDQGVVTVSETGVSIVSSQIEQDLKQVFGLSLSALSSYSFGVSYESDRKYILWTISTADDTWATQAYVYNTLTATWTRWDLAKRCGIVSSVDDKLYLGEAQSEYVNQERKAYDETDHVDYKASTTISAVSGDQLTVTLSSLIDQVEVGDVIYQSTTVFGIVESVDTVAGTATVTSPADFTVAACDILGAIETTVTFVPLTAGNAGTLKHWHTAILLFETDYAGDATVTFTSDLDRSPSDVTVAGAAMGNWGLFGWGQVAWGGDNGVTPRRMLVPRPKQISSQLTVSFAHRAGYSSWEMAGLAVHFNPAGDRVAR